jgi:septum formation protein
VKAHDPLILASASPRRRELLRAAGIRFRVVPSRAAESEPFPGEDPRRYARRAALDKGHEVSVRFPGAWILSADTIVAFDDRILGKPSGRRQAARMLSLLAGREHRVHTAVCLLREDRGFRAEAVCTTRVRFRPLSAAEIEGYLRTGESDDKAGAYAAQGAGASLIDRISGSFSNVVGLPMARTLGMLREAGLIEVDPAGPAWYRLVGGKG